MNPQDSYPIGSIPITVTRLMMGIGEKDGAKIVAEVVKKAVLIYLLMLNVLHSNSYLCRIE